MTDTDSEIFEVVRNLFAALTTPALPPIISQVKNGYAVEVSPEDQGRVVGKHGRTIWAISAVVTAASVRQTGKQTPVKLLDPRKRSSGIQLPYRPNPEWNRAIVDLMMEAFEKCFIQMRWSMADSDETHSEITIYAEGIDDSICHAVDIREAIEVIVRAAGMANGAVLTVKFK